MLNPRFLEIHCRRGGRSRGRKSHLTRSLVASEGWSSVRDRTNRKHCPSHKIWSYKTDGRWKGWSFDRGSTVLSLVHCLVETYLKSELVPLSTNWNVLSVTSQSSLSSAYTLPSGTSSNSPAMTQVSLKTVSLNPLRLPYVILRTQLQSRCDYDT